MISIRILCLRLDEELGSTKWDPKRPETPKKVCILFSARDIIYFPILNCQESIFHKFDVVTFHVIVQDLVYPLQILYLKPKKLMKLMWIRN